MLATAMAALLVVVPLSLACESGSPLPPVISAPSYTFRVPARISMPVNSSPPVTVALYTFSVPVQGGRWRRIQMLLLRRYVR